MSLARPRPLAGPVSGTRLRFLTPEAPTFRIFGMMSRSTGMGPVHRDHYGREPAAALPRGREN